MEIRFYFCKSKHLLVGLLNLLYVQFSAQCSGCTTNISSSTSSAFTVSAGQTLCVSSGVIVNGAIFLNGGTVCNYGTINNLKLNNGRGILKNYYTANSVEPLITFAGNVYFNCFSGSSTNFTNTTLNPGAADSITFQVYNGGKVLFASEISLTSKKLSVYSGLVDAAAPTNTNTSLFSLNGNLSVNGCALWFRNGPLGLVNISGSINLSNTGDKVVYNEGTFNVYNAVNIGGTGLSTTNVSIMNRNYFYIVNNLNCILNAGKFNYTNDAPTSRLVASSLILNKAEHQVTNRGDLNLSNITLNNGSITNHKTLTTSGNFINVQGSFYNNSFTKVASTFSNNGTVYLGFASFLQVYNYENTTAGIINGSTEPNEYDDYAKIHIRNNSTNSGFLNGKALVLDETLVSNSTNVGYGFDVVLNPGNILGGIFYGLKGQLPGTGNAPIPICIVMDRFFPFPDLRATETRICPGTCISITPYLYLPITFGQATSLGYAVLTNYLWKPGNSTAPVLNVCPASTQTYTFSTIYSGCTYSSAITITVDNLNVVVTPALSYLDPGVTCVINSQTSGGQSPYSCLWTVPGNPNPIYTNCNISPVSTVVDAEYLLTVTDANGCKGTATARIKPLPRQYADLNHDHDGSYYLMKNDRLYFKYTGQYTAGPLSYKIFDDNKNQITCPSLVQSLGDNRFVIDFSQCGYPGFGFYTLEIENEKKERTYLKFLQ